MCSESSRLWRMPALVVVALVLMGCIVASGAQPAANRAEASAMSADNGLRQARGTRNGRHAHRAAEPLRLFCGKALRDELARVCAGRGYNGMGNSGGTNSRGSKYGGAANHCCHHGCTRKDLDSYCNPRPTDSVVSESIEDVSDSTPYEEITATSNNQLRTNPVVQEEPTSVSVGTNANPDAEAENALFRESAKHKYYVKTNDFHQLNSPVTPRRHSTIR